MISALLALIGLFVALYLTMYKTGMIGSISCSIGSCETVNTSRWSTFLGLPVAAWGLGFYVTALAVAIIGSTDRWADERGPAVVMVALSGWGVLFSAWLTYLELFVIHAVCMWCVISAVIVTLIFITSVLDLRELTKEGDTTLGVSPSTASTEPAARVRRA
jgi:uncharacterized membrane protein